MNTVEFENVGKQYRLGLVSTGTISHDLNRWWAMNVLHREDPYLKVGETNDRAHRGHSDYVWALKDINFSVAEGEVVGIIGKNGAGKSTLLKILSRVTTPTTGEIRIRGRIASLLEVGTGFHPEMTGRENIYLNGAIMGMTKDEITRKLDEIVDFSGCERYIDTPVKRYSSGMRVRLGFAVAAHLEPEILVVDEVLAVGDAEFQKKAIGKMQDISQGGGRTVLFVSHNMDSMLNLCQKGVLLENGMIKYEGDIMSTVAEYLNSGNSDFRFTQSEDQAKTGVYVSSVGFTNQGKPSEGIFSFAEDISLRLKIRRKAGTSLDPKTVVSIIIMTLNRTRICNAEIPLSDMDDEKTFSLRYRAGVLLPNKYLIHVAIHIPNISYYDRQDTCTFTVYDNGTEFLKYNHANNGFIMFNPQVTEESSA
jgi:ABC-type polysaccharide/polyol phosphate transport system ATPase subunit